MRAAKINRVKIEIPVVKLKIGKAELIINVYEAKDLLEELREVFREPACIPMDQGGYVKYNHLGPR